MTLSSVPSLSLYLRQQQGLDETLSEYGVSPRLDLIYSQAHRLSEMHTQPLHALHLLKAMLHLPDGAAEQLLLEHGLTLEKTHETPLTAQDQPLDFAVLFKAMIASLGSRDAIGTEHLLLALLVDKTLQAYFAAWRLDVDKLREAALALAQ